MIPASSSPVIPYAMLDQKFRVPQFQVGRISSGVAGPRCFQATAATAANSAVMIHADAPPAFSVHFPIFIPMRLVPSATQMATSEMAIR